MLRNPFASRTRFVFLFLLGLSNAQYVQTKFVIGSTNGPAISHKPHDASDQKADSLLMKDYKDAHFNTMMGDPVEPRDSAEVKYLLNRAAAVGGFSVITTDRTTVPDPGSPTGRRDIGNYPCFDGTPNNPNPTLNCPFVQAYADRIIRLYGSKSTFLSSAEKKVRLGYYGSDEPRMPVVDGNLITPNIDDANSWINAFMGGDKPQLSFSILQPFYNPAANHEFDHSETTYRSYVNMYLSNLSPIAAFDHYPFEENLYPITKQRDTYFLNNQIFAEECGKPNPRREFWAAAIALAEHICTGNTMGPRYPAPTLVNLKMSAYLPLVYGAKGIIWYAYSAGTLWDPGCPDANADGWAYQDPTSAPTSPTGVKNPTYDLVKAINITLEKMGPELMSLEWQRTIHGSSTDPISNEGNLPTLSSSDDLLSTGSSFNGSIVVGILKNRFSGQPYIAVLNKDRMNSNSAMLVLKNKTSVLTHTKSFRLSTSTRSSFDPINKTTTVTVFLNPGDMALLATTSPAVSHVTTYLLY